jgi:putative transposase
VNSIFKIELIRNKGPWRGIADLEITTVEYINWFNHRRLDGELGMVRPVEFETDHYRHNPFRLPSKRHYRASIKPGASPAARTECPREPHRNW